MKQALDTRTKLLTKSPWPLMIELSIPAVLGMVVVGLYNMMDSIFVGQMVGDVQMGAISVSYPLTLINAGSAAMLGVGSASVLSRAIGKKDENTIKKIMGNLVAMVLLLSVIYTVVGMVFTRQLLSLTGASDNILNYAEKYLRIIFAGSLFVNFFQSANMVIRGEGQLKKAMTIIASGAILNIILDPIFIFCFKWGMMGAAVATVIGQVVTAILAVWYIVHMKTVKPSRKDFALQWNICGRMLLLGITSFLSQISLVAAMAAINNMLRKYGAQDPIFKQEQYAQIPMAVVGIVMKFFQIVISIVVGMAAGCIPIIGYNMGAEKKLRVKELFTKLLVAEALVGAVALVLAEGFPHQLIAIFGAKNESVYYTEFAIKAFRIYLCMMILACVNKACFIFLQAVGKALSSTMLSMFREVVFGVGFALLLPVFFGLDGVLYSMPVSDILTFIISAIIIVKTYKELNTKGAQSI